MLLITTSTGDELLSNVNIDDLEPSKSWATIPGDMGDMSPPIFGQGDNIQFVPLLIICPKTIKF